MPPPGDSRRFSLFGLGELWSKGEANSVERSKRVENLVPNLKLVSDKEVYRPGDSVWITIDLENPATKPVGDGDFADQGSGTANGIGLFVERLSFEFKGIEKLDAQWFITQRPLSGSKQQRRGEHVFLDCSISSMVSNQLVLSGCCKKYMVQTVLPTIIPPSYKGATVRYLYYARIALYGHWLIPENGHPNSRGAIRDPTAMEVRLPLQIWGCQSGNEYLVEEDQSEGISPSQRTQAIQTDIYWKEMDGVSNWVKANEAYDGVEEDYESSRDEVSSVSSYNPARDSIHTAFGSSLSLQSSSSRFHGREILHAEADEVSYNSTGDILSHSKPLGTLSSPSKRGSHVKSFSRDDDMGVAAASGNMGSVASEGFVRGRSYNIRLDDQVLLRFSPKKSDSNYYFSDMIGGTLTFFHEEGTRRCLEVSVTLEISETVNRRTVHPSRRNSPTITKVHSDYYEVVADLLQTSFLFSVPMDGPMSFSTPHISVQWALRFEFFTTPRNVDWTRYEHPLLVEGRDKCEWVLPIAVHAPQRSTSAGQSQSRSPSLDPLWNRD